jgi:hypothetical protein
MRRTGFDPFCGISLFREYFTFPKFRGLSGLNLREIAFGSTGVLCPPSAKFLTTFQENCHGTHTFSRLFWFPCRLFGFRGHVSVMTMNPEASFAVSDEQTLAPGL